MSSKHGILEREIRDLKRKLEDERGRTRELKGTILSFTSLLQCFKPYPCQYKDDTDAYYRIKHYIESINELHDKLRAEQDKIIELQQRNIAQENELKNQETELARLRVENQEIAAKQKEWEKIQNESIRLTEYRKRSINRVKFLQNKIELLSRHKQGYKLRKQEEEELIQLRAKNQEFITKQKEWEKIQEENIQLKLNRKISVMRIKALQSKIKELNQHKSECMKRLNIDIQKRKLIKGEYKKEDRGCSVLQDIEEQYQKLQKKFDHLTKTPLTGRLKREEHIKKMSADHEKKMQSLSKDEQFECNLLFSVALQTYRKQCGKNDIKIKYERMEELKNFSLKMKSIRRRRTTLPSNINCLLNDIKYLYNDLDRIDLTSEELKNIEGEENEIFQYIIKKFTYDDVEASLENLFKD